jgi:hypothetical protein
MTAHPAIWIAFGVFVLGMLAMDLGVFHRKNQVVRLKQLHSRFDCFAPRRRCFGTRWASFLAGCCAFLVTAAYFAFLAFGGVHLVDRVSHSFFG